MLTAQIRHTVSNLVRIYHYILSNACLSVRKKNDDWMLYFFPLDPQIFISGDILIVGKNYMLFCNASGSSVTRYKWRKDDVVLLEEGPLLYFSPLRLSDAGHYSCNTTHSNTPNLEFTLSGIRGSTLTQC